MFAVRRGDSVPNTPGWEVRVVPNKFPALHGTTSDEAMYSRFFKQEQAIGFHEVVIETPEHGRSFGDLSVEVLEQVLRVYQARLTALRLESTVQSIALFRNEGREAGASQAHAHAQILALPFVPDRLRAEVDTAVGHYTEYGSCFSCDFVRQETTEGLRRIAQNSLFLASAAFISRFPFETWILPTDHSHDFTQLECSSVRSLAEILRDVLCSMEAVLGRFPFNLILQTAPIRIDQATAKAFHWRFEILPRLTVPSGFELGTDVWIVSVSPEEAAMQLRAALAEGRRGCGV